MKTSLLSLQLLGAGLALVFANACIVATDDTSDGGGDGAETSGDGDGDASDQGGDGDGDGNAGDGDGDAGDGDGDAGDGDGHGKPDPAFIEACSAACEIYEGCLGPEGDGPGCVAECVDQLLEFGDDAQCLANELALVECVGTLSCEELDQFLNETTDPYPCQAEFEAVCDSPIGECAGSTEIGAMPGECSVTEACDGQPERAVVCDGQICTCFIDNVELGGCFDALAVCGDPGPSAIDACCG